VNIENVLRSCGFTKNKKVEGVWKRRDGYTVNDMGADDDGCEIILIDVRDTPLFNGHVKDAAFLKKVIVSVSYHCIVPKPVL